MTPAHRKGDSSNPILLTVGEPAGVGADCLLRAFVAEPEEFRDTLVVAPAIWLIERAKQCGLKATIQVVDHMELPSNPDALHCWHAGLRTAGVTPGRPDIANAKAVLGCIRVAAERCLSGQARAMVTGPIDKAVLRQAGFSFPGHTEFLAHLSGGAKVIMMLATGSLRVALLTTHMALRDVPAVLSEKLVLDGLNITARDLRHRFGIQAPRLALAALNPHAGEQGNFGDEEGEILVPAASQARQLGLDVTGPLAADSLFARDQRSRFDAIVCCYHDQALIPIKALSFGEAVNVTLGLPFVRTSVDHGTAYERAGSDQVSYSSFVAAIRMARMLTKEKHDARPKS